MRIDAHQHFWRYSAADYPWIDAALAPLQRDFLPGDALAEMSAAGFHASIAVQATHTAAETDWLLGLADANPFIAGVIGWVNLQADVDCLRGELRRVAAHPKLVGVRHIVQDEADDRFLLRPEFCRGIALLEEFDLVYDVLVYPRHLPVAAEFVERFPRQRFVLDHLAKPDIRGGEIDRWARDLRRVARSPHVWAKLSGLVTEASWNNWTPDQIAPYLDVAFDCFGPDRLIVGSDWPVCTVASDYGRTMALALDYLGNRPVDERDAVTGGNARRCWRVPT
jgi:L-fuconolactonase